jgi:tetratricopeptide (TPR) repeat protein
MTGAFGISADCQENSSLQMAKEHYARAKQHSTSGEQDKAVEELKLAIQIAPEFIEAHREFQDIQRNKTESLIREYDSYTRQNPKSAAFRYLLGRVYSQAGRRNEAEVEYLKALKLNPHFSWALLSVGLMMRDRGETSQAADAFEKARQKADSGLALHYSLASNLLSVKKYDSALEEATTVLQIDPLYFAAYPIKWRSKVNLSDAEKTLPEISNEIQQLELQHPKDIKALEAIQQGYELIIDKAGMARTRNAILAVDPNYFKNKQYPRIFSSTASNNRFEFTGPNAKRFVDSKDLADPKKQLDVLRDIEKEITDADIKFYLIYPEIFRSYINSGDLANAEGMLETLEKGGMPAFRLATHRTELARAYLRHKIKLDQALEQVEKADISLREHIKQYPPEKSVQNIIDFVRRSLAQSLHARGLILTAKGQTEKAIAAFAESVKEKEEEENTLDLGLLYIRTGRIDEGIKMLLSAYSFEGQRSQEARQALEREYGKRKNTTALEILLKETVNQRRLESRTALTFETPALLPRNEARPAPMFELATLSGRKVSLSNFKGKVLLINFWSTWCVPCLKEFPFIQKIYEERKEKDFELAMISVDDELNRISLFLKKNPSQALMLASDEQVGKVYELHGVPLLVLIDRNGMIRYRKTGFEVKDEEKLRQAIDTLLNEK